MYLRAMKNQKPYVGLRPILLMPKIYAVLVVEACTAVADTERPTCILESTARVYLSFGMGCGGHRFLHYTSSRRRMPMG